MHLKLEANNLKYFQIPNDSLEYRFNMPAASVASAPVNRTSNRAAASRTKKPAGGATKKAQPATNGATNGANPNMSPYTIMASRIANRVAEMAENITFVERERYARLISSFKVVLAAVEHNGALPNGQSHVLQQLNAPCVLPNAY